MAAPVRRMLVSAALVLALAGAVAPAASGSAKGVIRDCSEDGVLNGHYSHTDLTKALDQLPSDLDEYTDCRAVIRSAQLRSAGKQRGGGHGILDKVDAASPPSREEERKIAKAAGSGAPVKIGGKGVRPGETGAAFKSAGLGTDLPALVLVVLIALAAAMLAGAWLAIERHVEGPHPALARIGASRLATPFTKLAKAIRDGVSRLRR
jgi:hypothetical protein